LSIVNLAIGLNTNDVAGLVEQQQAKIEEQVAQVEEAIFRNIKTGRQAV